VRRGLEIAGEICIYTNTNITVLELDGDPTPRAPEV
jgi:ATP-dependent protease HslVU (ClpYQ) peptidase subunit